MPELEEPTDDDRERASRRRGTRIALVIAATGGAMALLAGAALALSTTARVVEMQPTAADTAEVDAVTAPTTPPSPLPTTATAPATTPLDAGEPEAPAEDPVYDASTDIASIPRPATESYEGELANVEIWLTQQGIVADCMLEQGFDFTFTPYWLRTSNTPFGLEPQMSDAERLALWGLNRGSGDDYDWRDAGCHGYAVHVTGMDDAN